MIGIEFYSGRNSHSSEQRQMLGFLTSTQPRAMCDRTREVLRDLEEVSEAAPGHEPLRGAHHKRHKSNADNPWRSGEQFGFSRTQS